MLTEFHRDITRSVLAPCFTDEAVEIAVRANDEQDRLRGQIAHAEYHVDNAVPPGYAYMLAQKRAALDAFRRGDCETGMRSLGRCLHAVQDFYSHTHYVRLWLAQNGGAAQATPERIPPLLDWLAVPDIQTGRITLQEALTYLPLVGRLFAHLLTMPADSHFALNLDGPHRGAEFAFVLEAARKHSGHIVEEVRQQIVASCIAPALPCVRQSVSPLP